MISVISQRALKYTGHFILKRLQQLGLSPKKDQYYFGYGTNLSAKRMAKNGLDAEFVGPAHLQGYRLEFNVPCEFLGQGYAGIAKCEGEKVYGALFKMNALSLSLLDVMEWVPFSFYARKRVYIQTTANTEISAWTYFPVHPRSDLKPSTTYLKWILNCGADLGLPDQYLNQLACTPSAENFDFDHSFSLLSPGRKRLFSSSLKPLYRIHDQLREKVARGLP